MLLLLTLALLSTAAYLTYTRLLSPPRDLAPGIPIVPLWVSLLPLLRAWLRRPPVGQDVHFELYLRPRLEQCGCVVLFFGGRWSLLVTHPHAVRALTAGNGIESDAFPKSGNHLKIPAAVISALTGGNIISEAGSTWAGFRKVIAPHLQRHGTQRHADMEGVSAAVSRMVDRLAESHAREVPTNDLVQRFTMQALLSCLFQRDIELFGPTSPKLHTIHSEVKAHIFDPFFLTFPSLDQWPWSLLFPSRPRALALIRALEREIVQTLAGRGSSDDDADASGLYASPDSSEELVMSILDGHTAESDGGEGGERRPSPLMRSMLDAAESGQWTARELIDNMKILFIAGHENTQQGLNSIIWMLAKHQSWQARLRAEIEAHTGTVETGASNIRRPHTLDDAILDELPRLRAFIYETLRLLPPIPQLINRKSREHEVIYLPTTTASVGTPVRSVRVSIPAGTYVGWSAYGLHRSRFNSSWSGDGTGEDEDGDGSGAAATFRPERWGATKREIESTAHKARERGELLTFHTGVRACLGQKFAITELMVAVVHLVVAFEIFPMLDRAGKEVRAVMTPGGLLRPARLPVRFVLRS